MEDRVRTWVLLPVLFSLVAPSGAPAAGAQAGRAAAPRMIQILTGDNMKYDPAVITAAPGESITIVLKHGGRMPKMAMGHNFVLLKKASEAKSIADRCASARDTEFIAPAVRPQLLAYTRLVGPGETAEVTFKAPAERGDYLFICTFTGHFALGMKGTLTVK
jgi:azurin